MEAHRDGGGDAGADEELWGWFFRSAKFLEELLQLRRGGGGLAADAMGEEGAALRIQVCCVACGVCVGALRCVCLWLWFNSAAAGVVCVCVHSAGGGA